MKDGVFQIRMGSAQRKVEEVVILMRIWCEGYPASQLRSSEIRLILSPMAVITHQGNSFTNLLRYRELSVHSRSLM